MSDSLPGLLTVVFVTLKLLGKIHWSWVWVLAPVWISVAVFLLCMVAYVIEELNADYYNTLE